MAIQFPEFQSGEDRQKQVIQGIQAGVGIANQIGQIGQMRQQQRKNDWEMAVQKAAYGTQIAANNNLSTQHRVNGLNKGLASLINDKRWGMAGDGPVEFTEADLKNETLVDGVKRLNNIINDGKLSPSEKKNLGAGVIMEIRSSLGQDKETLDLATDVLGIGKKMDSVGRFQVRKLEDGRVYTVDTMGELPPQPHAPQGSSDPKQSGLINSREDLFSFKTTNPRDFKSINDNLEMFGKKMEEDSVIKKQTEKISDLSQIEASLDAKNPAFTGLMTSILAKTIGREAGALAEGDVVRANGDPSILARVKRSLAKNLTGQIPESDRADFMELARIARSTSERAVQDRQEKFFEQARARISPKVTDEYLREALFGREGADPAGAPKAGKKAAAGLEQVSPAAQALLDEYAVEE